MFIYKLQSFILFISRFLFFLSHTHPPTHLHRHPHTIKVYNESDSSEVRLLAQDGYSSIFTVGWLMCDGISRTVVYILRFFFSVRDLSVRTPSKLPQEVYHLIYFYQWSWACVRRKYNINTRCFLITSVGCKCKMIRGTQYQI